MGANPFNTDLRTRLGRLGRALNESPQEFDTDLSRWTQPGKADTASHTGLLQNPHLVVDVTDRGVTVLPLLLSGRCYLKASVTARTPAGALSTDDAQDEPDSPPVQRRSIYGLGNLVHQVTRGDDELSLATSLHPQHPLIVHEIALPAGTTAAWLTLTTSSATMGRTPAGHSVLHPATIPAEDEALTRNNSQLPDPPRPTDLDPAVVGLSLDGQPLVLTPTPTVTLTLASRKAALLCDRWVPVAKTSSFHARLPIGGPPNRIRLMYAVADSDRHVDALLAGWEAHLAGQGARSYWTDRCSGVAVETPIKEIDAHVPYAVYNTLSARSTTDEGRSIFVHGRRDRGYADAAVLHQSYQMHLPALAAGWAAPVREELDAYAALQDDRGYISRQPRPGRGWHPYAGQYSNAHYILAVYRYLAWTGDDAYATHPVTSALDQRTTRTIAERVHLAADWLLHRTPSGLIPPCGWCDAWPPEVTAQGQVSAASVLALGAAADLADHWNDSALGRRYRTAAARLTDAIRASFTSSTSPVIAEHLYQDGTTAGGTDDDFWVPTQIWAVLAGVTDKPQELLALVADRCMGKFGLRAITTTSANRPYLAASTDNYGALSLDSTMTWLGATWPELTHLYALALTQIGEPDAALQAIARQLPSRIASENSRAPAHYYPEKYLYPGDTPWLCTWAGDPTLIEVLLTGFAGIRPNLTGLAIRPCVPELLASGFTVSFSYRNAPWTAQLQGHGSRVRHMTVNDQPHDNQQPLPRLADGATLKIELSGD